MDGWVVGGWEGESEGGRERWMDGGREDGKEKAGILLLQASEICPWLYLAVD